MSIALVKASVVVSSSVHPVDKTDSTLSVVNLGTGRASWELVCVSIEGNSRLLSEQVLYGNPGLILDGLVFLAGSPELLQLLIGVLILPCAHGELGVIAARGWALAIAKITV